MFASNGVNQLADADGRRVAVARYTEVKQVLVDGVSAGCDRRHTAVDGVESMGLAEVIGGGLRGTTDTRHLSDSMRLDAVFPCGRDDDVGNLVVATSWTQ